MPAPPRAAAVITTEINELRAAMASGALSVEYEGRKVTYRSVSEMLRALGVLEDELADANDEAPRPRRRFAAFKKGYWDSTADDEVVP